MAQSAWAQKTVKNEAQGFSLTLPENWTEEPLREDFDNTYLRVASPVGIEDAAIYVQIFETGRFTPETYRTSARRYITTRMEGSILADQEVQLGERSAWRIEYEGVSVGFAARRRHFMNTVFFHRGKIFVVHCAARSTRWEEFKNVFSTTSDSFVVADR